MKKPTTFFSLLLIAVLVTAQVPHRMSYQSVIRDTDNNLVVNQEIGMQISILQGAADGMAVYVERHFPETSANGLVSLEIGGGTEVSGSFEEIDWGADMYFIKTETDLQGGTSYTIAGVSQVLSVPYALHAKTAETATEGLEETDPVFMVSPAAGIEATHIDNWEEAFSWGDHEGLYRPEDWTPGWEDMPGGNHPGDMRYWDGNSWLSIAPGAQGQILTWCNGVPQWGPCLDIDLYDLVLHVDPAQGGTATGSGAYAEGTQVNIVASADPGWQFTVWTGDTDYLDNVASSNATVTMPAKSISLTANFQEEEVSEGTVNDIDGNVYRTVIIGNQEWMAENLRVTRYNNEEAIPTDLSDDDWENTESGAYAIYSHGSIDGLESDAEVVSAYGKLYNWYAVDDDRGLCPEGWSVPSGDDWTQLVDYVVSQGYPNEDDTPGGAGNALKSCRQVDSPLGDDCDTSEHPRWNEDDTHSGFDAFGFSALPGGRRWSFGSFSNVGESGHWWSTTKSSWNDPLHRFMRSSFGNVTLNYPNKATGISVRCMRDID